MSQNRTNGETPHTPTTPVARPRTDCRLVLDLDARQQLEPAKVYPPDTLGQDLINQLLTAFAKKTAKKSWDHQALLTIEFSEGEESLASRLRPNLIELVEMIVPFACRIARQDGPAAASLTFLAPSRLPFRVEVYKTEKTSPPRVRKRSEKATIAGLFATVPSERDDLLDCLAAFAQASGREIADFWQEALDAYLRSQRPETLEEKEALADRVSRELDRLGLAISHSDKPCTLLVAHDQKNPKGRFSLVTRGQGKLVLVRANLPTLLDELGPVRLIVAPRRTEPTSRRAKLSRQAKRSSEGNPSKSDPLQAPGE